jgi:hypothetical protein
VRTLECNYKLGNLAVTPDSRFLISHSGGDLKVWELPSGKEMAVLKGAGRFGSMSYIDRHIISVGGDLKVWDLTTGGIIANFSADKAVSCCAVNFDKTIIIAGDVAGQVYFIKFEGQVNYN